MFFLVFYFCDKTIKLGRDTHMMYEAYELSKLCMCYW